MLDYDLAISDSAAMAPAHIGPDLWPVAKPITWTFMQTRGAEESESISPQGYRKKTLCKFRWRVSGASCCV